MLIQIVKVVEYIMKDNGGKSSTKTHFGADGGAIIKTLLLFAANHRFPPDDAATLEIYDVTHTHTHNEKKKYCILMLTQKSQNKKMAMLFRSDEKFFLSPPKNLKNNQKSGRFFFFSPKPNFHDQKFLVVKNRVLGKKKRLTFFFGGGDV